MWKPLFDWFVQLFSGVTWSQFLAQHDESADAAASLRTIFRNDLYPIAGVSLIILTVISILIYYFIFNTRTGGGYGYKIRYWILFLVMTATVVSAVILWVSISHTGSYSRFAPFKFSLALAVASALYSAILFFIISIIAKQFSVANRTPF